MDKSGTNSDELDIGMYVEINPQRDRTRKQRVQGIIKDILTNSTHHPHGILVRLDSGDIGRVKKIVTKLSNESITPTTQNIVPDKQTLTALINQGENHFVEFKSSALWSIMYTEEDIKKSKSWAVRKYGRDTSKFIIAKTLAGFLNADGGNLIIGVKENKAQQPNEIIGIDSELFKLRDSCLDGFRRMIIDQVVKPLLPVKYLHHFNDFLKIDFEKINQKSVCWIQMQKGDEPVFLTYDKKETFFVRVDATTRELKGGDIVHYCLKRFG